MGYASSGGQITISDAESVTEASPRAPAAPDFLVHNEGDHVAVAVRDVEPGPARAVHMDSDRELGLEVREPIPLGHKVALVGLAPGAEVLEYQVRVGLTRAAVRAGDLVHTHNLKSARWQ